MGTAPDAVKRLIDARDMTAKTGAVPRRVRRRLSEGLSPVFAPDRAPSRADRKIFLSGDYKEEQLPKVKTPHEQESIQRQIDATDKQIGALVCELYGLTEDGIRIVAGAT